MDVLKPKTPSTLTFLSIVSSPQMNLLFHYFRRSLYRQMSLATSYSDPVLGVVQWLAFKRNTKSANGTNLLLGFTILTKLS